MIFFVLFGLLVTSSLFMITDDASALIGHPIITGDAMVLLYIVCLVFNFFGCFAIYLNQKSVDTVFADKKTLGKVRLTALGISAVLAIPLGIYATYTQTQHQPMSATAVTMMFGFNYLSYLVMYAPPLLAAVGFIAWVREGHLLPGKLGKVFA